MISKEELARIAQQTGLPLYLQEKEYLLKLFLASYYHRYRAVFKGGTCLRYLFGVERFSEDLDFNIKTPKIFQQEVRRTLEEFQLRGIEWRFLNEEIFSEAYTCEITCKGPLSSGTGQTQNKFRIDAGYRLGTMKKPEWKVMKSEYSDSKENILVLTMAIEEIMAEKVMALFQRRKGRDLYDLWFLTSRGVKLDQNLLQKKVKRENLKIDVENIVSQQDYERDMKRLSPQFIPYEEVRKKVLAVLREKT